MATESYTTTWDLTCVSVYVAIDIVRNARLGFGGD